MSAMIVKSEMEVKEFLLIIHDMIGDLNENLVFPRPKLQNMALAYKKLSDDQQEKCLSVLDELLSDTYLLEMNLMLFFLMELKEKKIIPYMEKMLISKRHPLWERLNDWVQWKVFLFTRYILKENERYRSRSGLYHSLLCEIMETGKISFPYIAYQNRRKKIILVLSQLVNIYHAPTVQMRSIYDYYRNMGYDVECFVCYFSGVEGYWNMASGGGKRTLNFMHRTSFFETDLDGIHIKGFNLALRRSDFLEGFRRTVRMIWEEKPEYVFEIGEETILAGLCCHFTTVVAMGCTKNIPVTNAPVIVNPAKQSKEEKAAWKRVLGESRIVSEVRYVVHELKKKDTNVFYAKEDFGIPGNAFVILLTGNRLDEEVEDSFLEILYQILKREACFAIAVIGKCHQLEEHILKGDWANRFFFLGNQSEFREAISIGDVFLNPPRQGGGTGGLFAILEGVPVITLDHCDVKENVGKEFVCDSINEMPSLVYKYFADKEFMEAQKANCRKRAMERTDINSEENFQRLSDLVRNYAVYQEKMK